jgi:hypothetical protein
MHLWFSLGKWELRGLKGESVDDFLMDNCKSIGRNVEIIRKELVRAMKKDLGLI